MEDSKVLCSPGESSAGWKIILAAGMCRRPIWKTVWLEYVNPVHLKAVKITPDLEAAAVNFIYDLIPEVCAGTYMIETIVSYEGTDISRSCRQIQRTYAEGSNQFVCTLGEPVGAAFVDAG